MPTLESPLTYSHTRCARALCAGTSMDILGPRLANTHSGKKMMVNHRSKEVHWSNKEQWPWVVCLG